MRKTVWTFGLIAGGVMSLMMVALLPFHDAVGDRGMLVGYTTMVLAFLFIYFGVRSYRDTIGNGRISFGRALAIGLLIMSVANLCYVATWEVIYYNFESDYLAKYQAHEIDKIKASGASATDVAKRTAEFQRWAELYKNPLINVAVTFAEPLPVGLIMSLLAAGLLRKRREESQETSTESRFARAAP